MCTSREMWWLCRGFGLGRCGLCICIRDGWHGFRVWLWVYMVPYRVGKSHSRVWGSVWVALNSVPTDNSAWQKRTQITGENRRHRWQWLRMQFNLFQLQRNYYDRRQSAVAEQFTQHPLGAAPAIPLYPPPPWYSKKPSFFIAFLGNC